MQWLTSIAHRAVSGHQYYTLTHWVSRTIYPAQLIQVVVASSSLARFGGKVRRLIPRLQCFLLLLSSLFLSGDQLARTNSTLYASVSSKWLSELRRLWLSAP